MRALLLFEGVVIRSTRFADIGHLAAACGMDAALAIVSAEGVSIEWDPAAIVRAGEPRVTTVGETIRLDRLEYAIARLAVATIASMAHSWKRRG
jgi:hypothetical protein